ncbi:MAG TPA: hypothetical protein VHE32_11535 [Rhodanobacteraceae bacterium]|nr:hypothetical protein [Rhodanobacteraceae bacterium]
MKRAAAIVAVALVLILATVAVRHVTHPSAAGRADIADAASREKVVSHMPSASVSIGSTRGADKASPSIDATPKVSSEMIARDADGAARAWWTSARRVAAAKEAKEFGADNARERCRRRIAPPAFAERGAA